VIILAAISACLKEMNVKANEISRIARTYVESVYTFEFSGSCVYRETSDLLFHFLLQGYLVGP